MPGHHLRLLSAGIDLYRLCKPSIDVLCLFQYCQYCSLQTGRMGCFRVVFLWGHSHQEQTTFRQTTLTWTLKFYKNLGKRKHFNKPLKTTGMTVRICPGAFPAPTLLKRSLGSVLLCRWLLFVDLCGFAASSNGQPPSCSSFTVSFDLNQLFLFVISTQKILAQRNSSIIPNKHWIYIYMGQCV